MSFGHALYLILIYPLQLLFEFAFSISSRHVSNYGYAIICLSLIVNIVVLPLYIRADKIQNEQREIEKKLNPGINHIKKSFSGDERFMMLQMYYKLNSYSPIMSLRSATSLLLQVPFFMAAYNLLSTLRCLNGVSFWFIKDLSQPDALFHIGTFSINVLPILMTLINVISGLVYTKGHPLKEKIQVNGMAALFLVILYNSASGLAFYWMLNNVFSLVKNVITYIFTKWIHINTNGVKNFISTISQKISDGNKGTTLQFILSQLAIVSLTAFYVPGYILVDSPLEFVNPMTMGNPLEYLLPSILIAFGLFVVWEYVVYWLLPPKGKTVFSWLSISTLIFFMANYFYVTDAMNKFEPHISRSVTYTVVIIISIALVLVLNKLSKFILNTAIISTIIFTLGIGFTTVNVVNKHYNDFNQPVNKEELQINLSTNGTNVVVIMLDRSLGYSLPYEFDMMPELYTVYSGFTYYPNTISFGGHTNFATPSLFGGYEYTPEMINKRADETLESKQNEALKMLPNLFSSEGYSVTVVDPPYAGYEYIPETNIYDDLDGVNAFYTGSSLNPYAELTNNELQDVRNRDFFLYGICKCMIYGRDYIYDHGNFNNPNRIIYNDNKLEYYLDLPGDAYKAVDHYGVLESLPSITHVTNDDSNNLLILQNELSHDNLYPSIDLLDPDFDVKALELQIDAICGDNKEMKQAFMANIASLYLVGQWLDYLKEIGVYDNTRIIIVSDHGYPNDFWKNEIFESYNPLLLYKDFDSEGYTISYKFMTNADTPYLAVNEVIDNPVNPYTGNAITDDYKYNLPIRIFNSHDFYITYNNGNTFMNSNDWYEINNTDSVFKEENWVHVIEEN